ATAFATREFLKKRNVSNYGAKSTLITLGLLGATLLFRFGNKEVVVGVAIAAAIALIAWALFKAPDIVRVVLGCIGALVVLTLLVISLIKMGKAVLLVIL